MTSIFNQAPSTTAGVAAPAQRRGLACLAALLAAALLAAGVLALASPSAAEARKAGKVRSFEGRIAKVERGKRTFVLRHRNGRVRIRVTRRTRFEDVRRFQALRRGMRVETKARYNGVRWVARVVDRDAGTDSDTDSDGRGTDGIDTDTDGVDTDTDGVDTDTDSD